MPQSQPQPQNQQPNVAAQAPPPDDVAALRDESASVVDPDQQAAAEDSSLFGTDASRRAELKKTAHEVVKYAIWTAAICVLGLFVVRMLHYVLPPHDCNFCIRCWLTETQIQAIDKSFFGVAVGGLLGKFGGRTLFAPWGGGSGR